MTRMPAMGERGEGWVAIQVVLFAWIAGAGFLLPGALAGGLRVAAILAGILLIAAGGVLAQSAILALQRHRALTALPYPREDARLVEAGAYRLVRHPIYGGLILGALGWSIARMSAAALAGALVLLAFFDLKRRREEAWLVDRFPAYAAYQARTRRLIPWVY